MATVLVADDDPDIRYLLEVNLQLSGHEVVSAGDGREALRAHADHEVDVAVLDVSMPDATGLEVIRSIRHGDRRAAIPIVLLTALAHPDDRERGLAAGADDYMTKPFSMRSLCSWVDRHAVTG
ncbi:response regulator transcription factor [Nocardioides abyssi]|uniref:Response regulator n=1 Tax=Nocardioides abyssi TaxID=3058370 RepID=A0ABT8ET92_9ACTN|nr:response regulator [Nocardioides abyssi]MDN4161319.1 response regulator [Nocardioides abyssi]